MKHRRMHWGVAVLFLLAPLAAHAQRGQAQGVNGYTTDEEQRARSAATAAGYTPVTLAFVQAGDFFFNATRSGQIYSLTVTPDGKVYPSTPSG